MIPAELERIAPPVPQPGRQSCESCKCMAVEVRVPVPARVGDPDTRQLCWGCAHAVCEHGAHWEHAYAVFGADCKCTAAQVYPEDVRARIDRPQVDVSGEISVPGLESSPDADEQARTASRAARDMRRRSRHGHRG